ncbi:hypothetical protein GCM10007416_24650 [Kroppenstedtia guangzhouensis]|uniref:Uncharacterized protein n=1 Tax=Kroppenstedtia guangzhouensis TaxID=1274356 RepID=A0ABQ1GVC9_9BACL|nr:hypothetical protein GCM10007416_24650 [Kroppenstedtia guangzhouensis]
MKVVILPSGKFYGRGGRGNILPLVILCNMASPCPMVRFGTDRLHPVAGWQSATGEDTTGAKVAW